MNHDPKQFRFACRSGFKNTVTYIFNSTRSQSDVFPWSFGVKKEVSCKLWKFWLKAIHVLLFVWRWINKKVKRYEWKSCKRITFHVKISSLVLGLKITVKIQGQIFSNPERMIQKNIWIYSKYFYYLVYTYFSIYIIQLELS